MAQEAATFAEKNGLHFNDVRLLTQAFIHRSYINENAGLKLSHNERLEFLGDAVLELVVTDFLYKKYPQKTEGDLTSYRAALVNALTIGDIAEKLHMNDYLLLSRGESRDTGKARLSILANTYEAVVGAIYLDQGYEASREFIDRTMLVHTEAIVKEGLFRDAKSLVQEKAQEHINITPMYRVMQEVGPDHDKIFTVGIFFGDTMVAQGKGKSKQEAEQKAAREALEKEGWA